MCVNPRIDIGSSLKAPLTSLLQSNTGIVGYRRFQYRILRITLACFGTRTLGWAAGSIRSLISTRGSEIYPTFTPSFFVTSFCVASDKLDSMSFPRRCSRHFVNSITLPLTRSSHWSILVLTGLPPTLAWGNCGDLIGGTVPSGGRNTQTTHERIPGGLCQFSLRIPSGQSVLMSLDYASSSNDRCRHAMPCLRNQRK